MEEGQPDRYITKTKYRLTNLEDPEKIYTLANIGENTESITEIPYGDYHVEQLQTIEGYELSEPIPTLHIDKEKAELLIENKKAEPDHSQAGDIEKEEPLESIDTEILKPLITDKERIKPLSLDSLTAFALSETARTASKPTADKTQTGTLNIKTVEEGADGILIEGAYYEVRDLLDRTKVFKLGPSGPEGNLLTELPYGSYSITQIVSGFGYEINAEIPDLKIDSEKKEIVVKNKTKPLELNSSESTDEPAFRSMNLFALNRMAMEPRLAAAFDTSTSFGPYTGSVGGGLGTYSWSASASGDVINWTLTVNVSSRASNQSPIAGYLEFSIPADQELQGSINSTGGVLLTDSPGRKYHMYTPNEKTVRTMQATFSTKIVDASKKSYILSSLNQR